MSSRVEGNRTFLRYGTGLVAVVAVLGMIAAPAGLVVVLAAVSMTIG